MLRSPVRGWFVTLGLGTGMGCSLVISEPVDAEPGNSETGNAGSGSVGGTIDAGGFTDGCDQSRYDLAGRVYSGQQARRNTVVPVWSLVGSEILVGG